MDSNDGSPCNLNALAILCSKHIPPEYSTDALDVGPEPAAKSLPDQALDAFAELAVSDPKEKFATAIRIDRHRKKATLYLASNQEIRGDTIDHLKGIWRKLQVLSQAYCTSDLPIFTTHCRGNSLPLQLEMDIMRGVYSFSHSIVRKRFEKWWPVLKWVKRCNGKASEIPFSNTTRLTQELEFTSMTYHLGLCSQYLDNLERNPHMPDRDNSFTPFNCNMASAASTARQLLGGSDFCEWMARRGDPKAPPRLRQAIKKLTSIQSHLAALFALARTSRKPPIFSYDLVIETVGPTSTVPKFVESWPKSIGEWQRFEQDIIGRYSKIQMPSPENTNARSAPSISSSSSSHSPPSSSSSPSPSTSFSTSPSSSCSSRAPTPPTPSYPLIPSLIPHTLLNLISHLTSRPHARPITLPYIGLSHRPCRGCSIWLETHNTLKLEREAQKVREQLSKQMQTHPVPKIRVERGRDERQGGRKSKTSGHVESRNGTNTEKLYPPIPYATRRSNGKWSSDEFCVPSLSAADEELGRMLEERWGRMITDAKAGYEGLLGTSEVGVAFEWGRRGVYGYEGESWVGFFVGDGGGIGCRC